MAGVFSNAYSDVLGMPALSGVVLLIVYAIEITSCFNNYFEFKGIKLRLSFNAIFREWFKKVSDTDVDITEKPKKKKAEKTRPFTK